MDAAVRATAAGEHGGGAAGDRKGPAGAAEVLHHALVEGEIRRQIDEVPGGQRQRILLARKTRAPVCPALIAAASPAAPDPMTSTSQNR